MHTGYVYATVVLAPSGLSNAPLDSPDLPALLGSSLGLRLAFLGVPGLRRAALTRAPLCSPRRPIAAMGSPEHPWASLSFPGFLWAFLGCPGLPHAPLRSLEVPIEFSWTHLSFFPGLPRACLGSSVLPWVPLGSPILPWLPWAPSAPLGSPKKSWARVVFALCFVPVSAFDLCSSSFGFVFFSCSECCVRLASCFFCVFSLF